MPIVFTGSIYWYLSFLAIVQYHANNLSGKNKNEHWRGYKRLAIKSCYLVLLIDPHQTSTAHHSVETNLITQNNIQVLGSGPLGLPDLPPSVPHAMLTCKILPLLTSVCTFIPPLQMIPILWNPAWTILSSTWLPLTL
jgi:hypothetical protein